MAPTSGAAACSGQSATDEPSVVIDLNLGEITRIVEQLDCLTDEGCEDWRYIAAPLESNAIPLDLSQLGDRYQQHVERLAAFGKVRQKAPCLPTLDGRHAGAAVRPPVIDLVKEELQPDGQRIETELRRRHRSASDQVAWQIGEKHVVEGPEHALDPSPPAWPTGS